MKLLEYQSKDILAREGVPVPPSGGVITKLSQLPAALKRAGRGPWVLKAQVLAGGRGKAGGIKLVKTPKEAKEKAAAILGMTMRTHQTGAHGIVVKELLVVKAADLLKEVYLSVALDRTLGKPVLIASAEGGVEIETLAKEHPEKIVKEPIDPYSGLEDYQARRVAFALGVPDPAGFVRIARAASRVFLRTDASLVEINPLAFTPKGWLAVDAKIVTDDNALFRQKEIAALPDLESSVLEKAAKKAGINYVGLDGTIGCMVNGAGLAMGTMDIVKLAGGSPANFLDVGGGATAEQVTKAFQILLRDKKVKAVLVNIFGGIMKCDVIAQGILAAVRKVKLGVPLVVRLEGTNVEQGKAILRDSGLKLQQADGLWDAAQKAVAAAA